MADRGKAIAQSALGDLSGRINSAHGRVRAAVSAGLEHACDAGQLLLEVKRALPRGVAAVA